jgi:hypothetical protein
MAETIQHFIESGDSSEVWCHPCAPRAPLYIFARRAPRLCLYRLILHDASLSDHLPQPVERRPTIFLTPAIWSPP